ncbi:MAG: hypothetical protein HOI95_12565 [Chromatiales bacterium]|jgi:hypothetical protein|nr:hypothetical protein [Chromatiales bacterium]
MSYPTRMNQDPFRNETELLKQIGLFQRKIARLGPCETEHHQSMSALYTDIIKICRAELDALARESALTVVV